MGRSSVLLVESRLFCNYLNHLRLYQNLHHVNVDLFRHVLVFAKEIERHDVPFTGDYLQNVDSNRKLGCANHVNIVCVLAKPWQVCSLSILRSERSLQSLWFCGRNRRLQESLCGARAPRTCYFFFNWRRMANL